MEVLDASAFIDEYHTDAQTASVPMVREELEDESAFRYDAMEGAGMHVHIPEPGTVEKVQRAAAETADRLDVGCLASAPFEPPDGGTIETARDTVTRADAVVATSGPERGLVRDAIDGHDAVVTVGASGQTTAPDDVVPAVLDTSRPDDGGEKAEGIVPTLVETLENPPTSADD